jgi:TrmH family RNA methyltransferase
MITSIQNPRLKLVRDILSHPKERQQSGRFVVEGVRLFEEVLAAGWETDYLLYSVTLTARGKESLSRAQSAGAEILEVDVDLLNRISDTEQSQGILAVMKMRSLPEPSPISLVMILDSIRDPGNLGTILRTAAAAGVQAVWATPDTADPFAPKALRAGMGAQFRLPISIIEWGEIALRATANGLFLYLSEMTDGTPLWQADLTQPIGLIVSNEANGTTPLARENANGSICIPMPGDAESLNASIAAGILLFEVVRQREHT